MWDFLLFMGFSMLETSAMYYLIFKAYKIDFFVKDVIFVSIVSSFISFVLRTQYNLPLVDVLVQVVLLFSFVWMMFRIHIFYAAIITGVCYQAYLLIQTSYYFLMKELGLFNVTLPNVLDIVTYTLQTASVFTAYMIGYYLSTKRVGFDFVPDKPRGKVDIRRQDKVLFFLVVPSVIIIALTMYFAVRFSDLFYLIPFAYAVILFGYLFMSYKKDRSGI